MGDLILHFRFLVNFGGICKLGLEIVGYCAYHGAITVTHLCQSIDLASTCASLHVAPAAHWPTFSCHCSVLWHLV